MLGVMGLEIFLHNIDAAELRNFVARLGEIREVQLASLPAVRAQQLGHAFDIPRRGVIAKQREHDAVHAFVEQ